MRDDGHEEIQKKKKEEGERGRFQGSWKVKLEEEGSVPRYAIDDSLLLLSI